VEEHQYTGKSVLTLTPPPIRRLPKGDGLSNFLFVLRTVPPTLESHLLADTDRIQVPRFDNGRNLDRTWSQAKIDECPDRQREITAGLRDLT